MKIIIFTDGFRKGGKERRLLELLKYMDRNDIDYYLVSLNQQIEYSEIKTLKKSIIHIKRKYKKSILPFFQFYKLCKKYKPEVIHSWSNISTFYSIPTAKILNIKLINSQITDAPPSFKTYIFYLLTIKLNFYFSDLIIANSYAGIRQYNPPQMKSTVVYNGIDLNRFNVNQNKEELKKKLDINTKYTVVMVASFSDKKDYLKFFNIGRSIYEQRKDVTFISVGDGIIFDKIKNIVLSWNIHNIKLFGARDDIEKILKACDIGVLLTNKKKHGEGISNSILEYMASRIPVITNNTGGTSEIIVNRYNGYIIESENNNEYMETIIHLLNNEELYNYIVYNGRKTIEEKFTVDRMFSAYYNQYQSIVYKNNIYYY